MGRRRYPWRWASTSRWMVAEFSSCRSQPEPALGAIGYFQVVAAFFAHLNPPAAVTAAGTSNNCPSLPRQPDGAGKPGIGPLRFAQPAAQYTAPVLGAVDPLTGYWPQTGHQPSCHRDKSMPVCCRAKALKKGISAAKNSMRNASASGTGSLSIRTSRTAKSSAMAKSGSGEVLHRPRPTATKFRRPGATKGARNRPRGYSPAKGESDVGKSPGTNGAQRAG